MSVHTGGVRRVVIAGYPDIQMLDVVGPAEVFATANRLVDRAGVGGYEVVLATLDRSEVDSRSGLRLAVDADLGRLRGPLDTLVVPGGSGTLAMFDDTRFLRSIQRLASRSRRVASVCSGAYLLAAAGLLDGRRATTHWSECERFAELFPAVTVEPDSIYVRDDPVWTSAGVTAGIDLSLALIEADHGRDLALAVARWLVVFVRRPGGQSQFSAQLAAQFAERDVLRDLQGFIGEHPDADLTVAALARRAYMSERHFARVFAQEVGMTPAAYVERVRTDVARRLLEETALGLDGVAAASGFGSVETLRRAVHRHLGVAPSDYRQRFRASV